MNTPSNASIQKYTTLGKDVLQFLSPVKAETPKDKIRRELTAAGLLKAELLSLESRYLHTIIHPNEDIMGAVFGRSNGSLALLVATNLRVVYLDKKILFVNEDEVTYWVVSGVKLSHAGIGSTVTLHTRVKDFTIQTLNLTAAQRFVGYIESRAIEHV